MCNPKSVEYIVGPISVVRNGGEGDNGGWSIVKDPFYQQERKVFVRGRGEGQGGESSLNTGLSLIHI